MGKTIWIIIYLACLSNFFYQAAMVVAKFNRNEKIVDIAVRFAFPFVAAGNYEPLF